MSIEVACPCGKRFLANQELAGKRVSCPSCQQPFMVPHMAAAAKTLTPIPPASSAPGYSLAGPPTGPRAMPRKFKKKKSNIGLYIALGGAAIGLAGLGLVVVVGYFVMQRMTDAPVVVARGPGRINRAIGPIDRIPGNINGSALNPSGRPVAPERAVPWMTYTSAIAHCSIEMPARPTSSTRTNVSGGVVRQTHTATLKSNGATIAMAFANGGVADLSLEDSCQQVAGTYGGAISSAQTIKVVGYDGREIVCRGGAQETHARVFRVNQAVYQLTWSGPRSQIDSSDVQRFFDSFQLIGVPPATPTSHPFAGRRGAPGVGESFPGSGAVGEPTSPFDGLGPGRIGPNGPTRGPRFGPVGPGGRFGPRGPGGSRRIGPPDRRP